MSLVPQKFEYLKSPDGEDLIQKAQFIMKRAATACLAVGTLDVMLYSHPKGYLNTLGRYLFVGAPIIGAASAFVITSNLVGSMRKKDDGFNWVLGGATVGATYGIWRGKPSLAFFSAFVLGSFFGMFKHAIQNGYELFPPVDPEYGSVRSVNYQWSYVAERPGNWTTGEK